MSQEESRYGRGLAKMREIFGPEVETAVKALAATSPDLARYLVEFPFGDIYPRPSLDAKTREMLTVQTQIRDRARRVVIAFPSRWTLSLRYRICSHSTSSTRSGNRRFRYDDPLCIVSSDCDTHQKVSILQTLVSRSC